MCMLDRAFGVWIGWPDRTVKQEKIVMKCRFCRSSAIAIYELSKGCFCYPEDKEQALCPQHIVSATPIGTMELKEVIDTEIFEWFISTL